MGVIRRIVEGVLSFTRARGDHRLIIEWSGSSPTKKRLTHPKYCCMPHGRRHGSLFGRDRAAEAIEVRILPSALPLLAQEI